MMLTSKRIEAAVSRLLALREQGDDADLDMDAEPEDDFDLDEPAPMGPEEKGGGLAGKLFGVSDRLDAALRGAEPDPADIELGEDQYYELEAVRDELNSLLPDLAAQLGIEGGEAEPPEDFGEEPEEPEDALDFINLD